MKITKELVRKKILAQKFTIAEFKKAIKQRNFKKETTFELIISSSAPVEPSEVYDEKLAGWTGKVGGKSYEVTAIKEIKLSDKTKIEITVQKI